MFHQLRIASRMLALAVISGLLTIVVGVAGLSQMSKINDMLNSMYNTNLVPIADVANANMQAIYHNRAMLVYVADADCEKMKESRVAMEKHTVEMNKLLDKYRKTLLTPPEVALLAKIDAAWPQYVAATEKAAKIKEGG